MKHTNELHDRKDVANNSLLIDGHDIESGILPQTKTITQSSARYRYYQSSVPKRLEINQNVILVMIDNLTSILCPSRV